MRYYYKHNAPSLDGAKLVKVERNKLNPLPGLTFVSISFWKLKTGEIIGTIF